METITNEMIAKQREEVNKYDFATQREQFENEFDKLSAMIEEYNIQNPIVLPDDWCETDGKWYAS